MQLVNRRLLWRSTSDLKESTGNTKMTLDIILRPERFIASNTADRIAQKLAPKNPVGRTAKSWNPISINLSRRL